MSVGRGSWAKRLSTAVRNAGDAWTLSWRQTLCKVHGHFLLTHVDDPEALVAHCTNASVILTEYQRDEIEKRERERIGADNKDRMRVLASAYQLMKNSGQGVWRWSWKQTLKQSKALKLMRLVAQYMDAVSAVYSKLPTEISAMINLLVFA